MTDVPHTRLINFVDTPAAILYGPTGDAFVPLDPQTGPILKVHEFRRVSVEVGSTRATSCQLFMGKLSNSTLGTSFNVPLGQPVIHTFEIVGPEISLLLKGVPGSAESVQLWVYLRS